VVIIRPTGDLAKRMKVKLKPVNAHSETRLGDWYSRDVVIENQQYILCVSEHGRLPIIFKAAPYSDFPTRLPDMVSAVLRGIGIPDEKVRVEVSQMREAILAKTANRSVLGSMNEFRFTLQRGSQASRLQHEPLRVSLWMADLISLILPDFTPKNTVLKIFGEPIPPRRRSHLTVVASTNSDCSSEERA
jgi:hypothetical protein